MGTTTPWRLVAALSLGLLLGLCQPAVAADLADFKCDGCSLFPDGNYYGCCYLHDVAYWAGGTAAEREASDQALRACVLETTGSRVLAAAIFYGVRVGGTPRLPTPYRWGFGWPYTHRNDYAPLTPEERAQVVAKTAKLCASFHVNPATGGIVVDVGKEITLAQARMVCPGLAAGQRARSSRLDDTR